MTFLQQFDRDAVRRTDKGHMAIARRTVDGDACVHQPLAGRINIVDPIGKMTEIPTAAVIFGRAAIGGWPVIGQLDLCNPVLTGRGKKDQREAPRLAVETPHFLQPDQIEKGDSRVGVGHADHRVQIFRRHNYSIHLY